jgi:hypothetical protein
MLCRFWRRWRRRWTRLPEGRKEFFLASQDEELGREKDEVDEGREEVHVSKLGRSMGRQLAQTNQELPGNRPSPSYRGHSAAEELLRGPVHTLQEALVHHGLFSQPRGHGLLGCCKPSAFPPTNVYTLRRVRSIKEIAKESWALAWVSNSPG